MPEKPSYVERQKRISIQPEAVPVAMKGWGKPDQGVTPLLKPAQKYLPTAPTQPESRSPQSTQKARTKSPQSPATSETLHESVIAPSGSHLESEIRHLSHRLVSSVIQESHGKPLESNNSPSINPDLPKLDKTYIDLSIDELNHQFNKWYSRILGINEEDISKIKNRFKSRPGYNADLILRFFMAYFKPMRGDNAQDLAIIRYLCAWMQIIGDYDPLKWKQMPAETRSNVSDDFNKFGNGSLLDGLTILFGRWKECVPTLAQRNEFGEEEKRLAGDIERRVERLKEARADKEVRDAEEGPWKVMWNKHFEAQKLSKERRIERNKRELAATTSKPKNEAD